MQNVRDKMTKRELAIFRAQLAKDVARLHREASEFLDRSVGAGGRVVDLFGDDAASACVARDES